MKHAMIYAVSQDQFDQAAKLLQSGWLSIETLATAGGVVFHLASLEDGETPMELVKASPYADVTDVKQLKLPDANGEVERMVSEGYEVHSVLKDCVQLLKRKGSS